MKSGSIACAAAALAAIGCSSERAALETAPDGTATLPVPSLLRNVDRSALRLTLTVNGAASDPIASGDAGRWRVAWNVPPGEPIRLSVRWHDTSGLTLATLNTSLSPVNANGDVPISENDYTVEIHDDDADGWSNLAELRCDSDPRGGDSIPDFECADGGTGGVGEDDDEPFPMGTDPEPIDIVDVEIPRTASAPVIDGLYEPAWDAATFDGTMGPLSVDHPMIDRDAGPRDSAPGYKWGAMHDGENLYVYVEGKPVDAPVFADSPNPWDDDALNLFVDGDGSAGTSYDGVDDWHVFMPLADTAEDTLFANTENGRVQAGPGSPGIPSGLRFTACLCTSGRHTWELSVPLASLGVEVGRPFGIEIQIDEDNNGGGRDARFGWVHPIRQGSDVDFTYLDPSYMGRARLF